ncbi:MAG: alpha/beta hydrolase [Alkalibacterium sp.]|uniref:alpha/beta hydrolase n=1 Tax=Alkalibacterium sp. TaxID=1872447 RepID=UPI0039705F76
MKHIFKKGTDLTNTTLLLLHGTGGTEQDLLPLAAQVDPQANVLSVRGNIDENGMFRYFKRLRPGVFDEADLKLRTEELKHFLSDAANEYGFDRNKIIAIGYSNGANIAGSLLFHDSNVLKGAILHHPMVPLRGLELPDLSGTPIFIGAGTNDPICASEESEELEHLLSNAGADVTLHWENHGHQLTGTEINVAKEWYKANKNRLYQ